MAKDSVIEKRGAKARKKEKSPTGKPRRGMSLKSGIDWYAKAKQQIAITRDDSSSTALWVHRADEDRDLE